MSNIFYSHSKETPDGKIGTKRLSVHIDGVSQKAGGRFLQNINFSVPSNELKDLLQNVCKFHDLGKYTHYFQSYLLNKGKVESELKKHSRIGAYVIFEKYRGNLNLTFSIFSYFLIISHHSDLIDISEYGFKEERNSIDYKTSFDLQKKSILKVVEDINKEIDYSDLTELLIIPKFKTFRNEVRKIQKSEATIQKLLSCKLLIFLID